MSVLNMIGFAFMIASVCYFLWEIAQIFYPSEQVRMMRDESHDDEE